MTYLVTISLIITCISAIAQKSSSISKTINDNDKTMTLIYKVDSDDKHINYENSFNIQGLTKDEKNILIDHIIDSLNNTSSNQKTTVTQDSFIKISDDGFYSRVPFAKIGYDQNTAKIGWLEAFKKLCNHSSTRMRTMCCSECIIYIYIT